MSKIQKSSMTVNGNSVHLSMPFAKVDEAKRLVSGFATLDNIDSQGDVVLAEASANAFARARGNIREMHQPLAVGRMVDFRENEFFHTDEQTGEGKFYRGIFVTARVSEGAEDTWKKVLDGTLQGFSIGGEIKEASNEFVKEAGKVVRFIKDYDLTELSLVDNPANQLANIDSIQKNVFSFDIAEGGERFMKGMVADTVIENVFVCNKDETVTVATSESEDCPMCGTKMENAGWFESGSDRTEKVQRIVTEYLHPSEEEAAPISESEGGVDMAKNKTKKSEVEEPQESSEEVSEETPENSETEEEVADESAEESEEETEDSETVDEAAGTEEEEESAESPEEVTDDETEISKKIDDLHEAVKSSLEENKNETLEKVAELEKRIESATETFLEKASELESKMGEFGKKLATAKSRLSELESGLEKMNSSEALRKSADLEEGPAEKVEQNGTSWNGAFSVRKPSGGFTVDNLM